MDIHTVSDVTAYYLTLIAVRYDFKFTLTSCLLNDYEEIKTRNYGIPGNQLRDL